MNFTKIMERIENSNMLKQDIINLLIIFLLPLIIVFIWFRSGLLLAYTDLGLIMYDPQKWFDIVRYVWFDLQSTGHFFPQLMFIPIGGLMTVLYNIGFSPVSVQETIFYFSFLMNGLSMYYLSSTVIKDKDKSWISLLAALFYMFNPYVLFNVWIKFNSTIWSLSLIPLLLALYINTLEKRSVKYALLFGLTTLLFSSSFPNPAFDFMIAFILFLYFIVHIFWNINDPKEVYSSIKLSVLIVLISVALNFWWLFPWLFSFKSSYESQLVTVPSYDNYEILSKLYDLGFIVRLLRKDMLNWLFPYSTNLIFIGFLIPIISFISVITNYKSRHIFFFTFLVIIGLFIGKGIQQPFGEFSKWLFQNIPGFIIFRNPFEKAGILVTLGYSLLFSTGTILLYRTIKENNSLLLNKKLSKWIAKFFVLLSCILILVVYVWPMWTGELFIRDPQGVDKSNLYVEVPKYYEEANNYINSKEDEFRILVLPLSGGDSAYYNWEHGYSGKEPSFLFFDKPTVSMRTYNNLVDDITIRKIPDLITKPTNIKLWKIFSILNIKYVIVNYDTNDFLLTTNSPDFFARRMKYETIIDLNKTNKIGAEDLSEYWVAEGAGDIFIHFQEKSEEKEIFLKIDSRIKKGGFEGGVKYTLPEPIDFSKQEYLTFKLKIKDTTGIGQVRVKIFDINDNWYLWDPSPPKKDEWQDTFVLLENPDFTSKEKLDLSQIRKIYISFVSDLDVHINTEWWIDGLMVFYPSLEPRPYIKNELVFGNLKIFELEDKYFLDKFYTANEMTIASDLGMMLGVIESSGFTPGKNLVFVENQLTESMRENLRKIDITSLSKPSVEFERIDPVTYSVNIQDAESPYFLVFSETYHPSWDAYINGEKIEKHFIVNGYANAWYIDKPGSYEIKIEFWLQKLFYYCVIISLVSSIICISYFLWILKNDRKSESFSWQTKY